MYMNALRSTYQRRRGFTLLELMVVMFILVLLASVVAVEVTKRVEDADHAKAVADIDSIGSAIDQYQLQNHAYPPNLDALYTQPTGVDVPNWHGPYIKKPVSSDPWGQPYIYVTPGVHNPDSYDLSSLGKDKKEGGTGVDADITNWTQPQ